MAFPAGSHGVATPDAAAVPGKAPNFVLTQIGSGSGGGTAGRFERISTANDALCDRCSASKPSEVIETEMSGAVIRLELGVKLGRFRPCCGRLGRSVDCAKACPEGTLKGVLAAQPVETFATQMLLQARHPSWETVLGRFQDRPLITVAHPGDIRAERIRIDIGSVVGHSGTPSFTGQRYCVPELPIERTHRHRAAAIAATSPSSMGRQAASGWCSARTCSHHSW
ncbi:hypothetical protein ACVWYQ_003637 [Bradyrhizobium sp. USDA 3397]